jgi:hypothetical protein
MMKFMEFGSDTLVISDYKFYADYQEEIDDWCWQKFGYHPREGMVVHFKHEQDMTLFLLRWA